MTTNEQKRLALELRIANLESRGDKNEKSPGVLRKLKRKLIKIKE